jgi:hypothetical protein
VDFTGTGVADMEIAPVGAYLHEPDISMINAQLLNDFCIKYPDVHRIDPESTWLTSDIPFRHPMIRSYQVDDVLPNDTKALRKALVSRNIGDVTIKSRGMNISTDSLRKELKLSAGASATIVIVIANKQRATLLVHHNS